MKYILLILLISQTWNSNCQYILQGPTIGGVTDHSARIYLRSDSSFIYKIELSTKIDFSEVITYSEKSRDALDYSAIINIKGLLSNTTYYYRLYVNEKKDEIEGQFKTFPKEGERGDFSFVTGSCQETENMKVFDVMPNHHPYFLLHTGDYTYPDYQIKPDYSGDYKLVAYSYQKRYDEKVMKEMLQKIPIDYIYDDNDYVGSSGGKYVKNDNKQHAKLVFDVSNEFYQDTFPPHWRMNCIRGYTEFFPGYEMVDTNVGIFHSFKFGNAEVFFLDRCSNTPHYNGYAFRRNEKGNWIFDPPNDHVLFGKEQMDWLKKGLKNSTADWKFIVSGVPFNRSLRLLIDAGINYQNIGWGENTGMRVAAGFSHYWAGHPYEMDDFFDFLKSENIQDVIAISGDTHHNVMDDGKNAGIPEMNASGLSVSGTELGIALNTFGKITGEYNFKKDIWNQGGNGIDNFHKKNAFGKLRIVENKYVEMSIIDEDNEVINCFRVYHSSNKEKPKSKRKRRCDCYR